MRYVNYKLLHEAVDYSQIVNPSGDIECLQAPPEDTHIHAQTQPQTPLVPGSRAVGSPVACQCVQ